MFLIDFLNTVIVGLIIAGLVFFAVLIAWVMIMEATNNR